VAHFGTLQGIQNISPKKEIEIVPFVLSQLTLSEMDFSGKSKGWGTESFAYIQFKNYYNIAGGLNINYNGNSTTLLRGGPSIRTPGVMNGWFSIESDSRKKFQAEYDMSFRRGFENSATSVSYGLDISYKPSNLLSSPHFLQLFALGSVISP